MRKIFCSLLVLFYKNKKINLKIQSSRMTSSQIYSFVNPILQAKEEIILVDLPYLKLDDVRD